MSKVKGTLPDITLYLLQDSQALRILWLLKYLQLPYTLTNVKRRADREYPVLRSLHPLGKSPIVTLDGAVIAESRLCARAIASLTQILDKTGDEARHDAYFEELAVSTLSAATQTILIFSLVVSLTPAILRPLIKLVVSPIMTPLLTGLHGPLDLIDAHLAQNEWLGGARIGVSDFMMSWPIDLSVQRHFIDLTKWKHVKQWHDTILGMQSYQEAVHESVSYDLAGKFGM